MLEGIAKGIAQHFGTNCEVAIHDLTHGISNTVAIIENGHVTGREIGDSASETVLEAIKNKDIADRYAYIINSKDGKMIKSSTINIHDDKGTVIAVICLNFDISDFAMANRSLNEFLATNPEALSPSAIPNNITDLLDQLIEESRCHIGKPISAMTREDKTEAIRYLDRKGALLIKKSSERICEYYGISKYTLYNYLGESAD
jgi:predicted transcriptional regulator YheO